MTLGYTPCLGCNLVVYVQKDFTGKSKWLVLQYENGPRHICKYKQKTKEQVARENAMILLGGR